MYQFINYFIVVLIVQPKLTLTYESGCSILTSDLEKKQPLILNEHFDFFYPENGVEIFIPKNKKLIISCIEGNNFELKSIKSPFVNVTCVKDKTFLLGNDRVHIEDLLCKKYPKPTARATKKKCGKSFKEIEIGFKIAEHFVRVLIICFNPNLQSTLYSHFRMTKWIAHGQVAGRISWRNDFYLDVKKVDTVYTKKCQKKIINSLLELPANSNEIVKNDNRHYLARGHLAAKADFYYAHQQSSTFFSINAAPQWQTFNNGNWKTLEIATRKLASSRKLDLEIYTGTYETLEMISFKTKIKVGIHLLENNGKKGLPVPHFFWKIVYDPDTQAGVAFIGINNPYATRNQLSDLRICRSISDKIKWVSLVENNLDLGYTYACTLREFLNVVKYAPRLRVRSLLV